jgi:hypothetical protein
MEVVYAISGESGDDVVSVSYMGASSRQLSRVKDLAARHKSLGSFALTVSDEIQTISTSASGNKGTNSSQRISDSQVPR